MERASVQCLSTPDVDDAIRCRRRRRVDETGTGSEQQGVTLYHDQCRARRCPACRAVRLAHAVDLERDLAVVGAAGDGVTALDLVTRLRPGIVVMEVAMPAMDGFSATALPDRVTPYCAVVLLGHL